MTYEYDNYSHANQPMLASGAVQHDSSYNTSFLYRGNKTAVSQWLNTTNSLLTTTNQYDDAGNLISSIDPLGNKTTFDYADSWNNATCAPANSGQTKAYVTKTTNALGQFTTKKYNSCTGSLASIIDPNLQTTNYFYSDPLSRLTSVTYPDGGQVTNTYDDTQLIATIGVLKTSTTSVFNRKHYDGLGRPSQTELCEDGTSSCATSIKSDTAYDSVDRVASVSNPYRATSESTYGITQNQYDVLNRNILLIPTDGTITSNNVTTTYAGNCTSVTDEAGRVRKSCSDAMGRLTQVFEDPSALNYETDYAYDTLDNLISVTQTGGSTSANWRTRTFTYDSLSRLLSATNPESGTITYTYDADGNVITKTTPLPNQTGTATVTTTNTYDKLNRLTSKSYKDGIVSDPYTPTVQFGYDAVALTSCTTAPPGDTDTYPVGRRTSMCDGSGGASWTHDKMGRILQERRTIGAVVGDYDTDAYNLDGSIASITSLGYSVGYIYNGAGRPISATDYLTPTTNFVSGATYAPPGELATMTNGSTSTFAGIVTNNGYNKRLQPILLSAGVTGQSSVFSECFDFHLGVAVSTPPCSFSASTLGDSGNVYQIVNNRNSARTESFTYDSLNRIASAQSSGSQWGETFTIDAWGNLTAEPGITGKTSHESLNTSAGTNNRLAAYGYDAAGNLISNGSTSYVYDAENRLVWTSGYRYLYDGDGQRAEKCAAATATTACPTSGTNGTLYWRGTNSDPLTETDLSGNTIANYIFFNGQRVARRDPATNAAHYYFSDHLGSHGVVENATASVCEQDIDYYPYGGVQNDYCPAVPQKYKFTGKERDSESGLDSFGFRHYASTMGRWMSPDLVNVTEERVVSPANTLNKYVYGGNNPLKYVDPDGRDITYFYDQGGIAGHAILFAYNQATGDSAIESFGPTVSAPIAPGESMHEMSDFRSADDLRSQLTSLTIQTTPELAQQVIDYIRANPDPALWFYAGPNCSSQVWKILQKFKLAHKSSRLDGRPGNTPRNLWMNLIQQNNPFRQGLNPKNGIDYGNPRFDMFNLLWFSLPQAQPKATVTVTVTNCVTDSDGKKTCTTSN